MPSNQSLALVCCTFLVWIASSQASAELSQSVYSAVSVSASLSCGSSSPFVFTRPDQRFTTDYGEFKAVILEEENLLQKRRLAVGMLTMEPLSLFLPHYVNGPALVYVHRGMYETCVCYGSLEIFSVLFMYMGCMFLCVMCVFHFTMETLDDLCTMRP
jgi:hypothetical protein